ncbi:MAG TPA: class II fumarate hydratase [Gammaproteobacteria bacterium]|nr:class II fumarate hydratase [Gammaproteobacteria bacterium]
MSKSSITRTESDSMGSVQIPDEALYGPQTQRAINNFPISRVPMPRAFIRALGLIKAAAAYSNADLDLLPKDMAKAIENVSTKVANGEYDDHFCVDVFQSGSGTSSNMNANEVIAHLAADQYKSQVHANDHVNMGQSSNDVIPAAIHISCCLLISEMLLPALHTLLNTIEKRSAELKDVTKTGRTHLMDAMPVTFGQELSGWAAQLKFNMQHIEQSFKALCKLQLGGTAVGTGINTHKKFAKKVCQRLASVTRIDFEPMDNFFAGISAQDTVVEFSAQLRGLSIILTKICNDLRLMNSGPLAGLAEIVLPALQPGSSIMPGKVNPVVPESVLMICAQVMGNDLTIAIGGQSGNFQLNTMLPVIAFNIIQSITILSNGAEMLATKAIADFVVNHENINLQLGKNPILVTALNKILGYEMGAKIAKKAYDEKRSIKDVAKEFTQISEDELAKLLDPQRLTGKGD